MEPVKRLVDSFGVDDMTQAEQETIEIFCRVLSQELTRETGHKIEIDPRSLPGYSGKPGITLKDRERVTTLKHVRKNDPDQLKSYRLH
jgi:hypothetical protein